MKARRGCDFGDQLAAPAIASAATNALMSAAENPNCTAKVAMRALSGEA